MDKVSVIQELDGISEHWSPKIIGSLNNHMVKAAKLQGEFLWHKHDDEDEMFYVIYGNLTIKYRDRDVELCKDEFIVIPKGVEHMPVCKDEVHILLIEPKGTLNTGDVVNERTVYLENE